ncbi:hypothetical protein ACQP1G_16640 [Nocardia sp. CA-107356]|uniref:hypothetical protein n=1 Tax=Nocardia sp. CA-107356 TaxID=3239972 RepID=UPI003D93D343
MAEVVSVVAVSGCELVGLDADVHPDPEPARFQPGDADLFEVGLEEVAKAGFPCLQGKLFGSLFTGDGDRFTACGQRERDRGFAPGPAGDQRAHGVGGDPGDHGFPDFGVFQYGGRVSGGVAEFCESVDKLLDRVGAVVEQGGELAGGGVGSFAGVGILGGVGDGFQVRFDLGQFGGGLFPGVTQFEQVVLVAFGVGLTEVEGLQYLGRDPFPQCGDR